MSGKASPPNLHPTFFSVFWHVCSFYINFSSKLSNYIKQLIDIFSYYTDNSKLTEGELIVEFILFKNRTCLSFVQIFSFFWVHRSFVHFMLFIPKHLIFAITSEIFSTSMSFKFIVCVEEGHCFCILILYPVATALNYFTVSINLSLILWGFLGLLLHRL